MLRSVLVGAALGLLGACARGQAGELSVLAAASLRDACTQLAADFEAGGGPRVVLSFAGSNLLAQQVLAGAPCDVLLLAGEEPMDALERAGLLAPGSRHALLSNALVVVQPEPLPDDVPRVRALADLLDERLGRLALANPEAVPAGRYARELLDRAGLWEALEPRIVPAVDVRAALALVESGAVSVGIVYATDAAVSSRVAVSLAVAPAQAPRVVYPVAIPRDARAPLAARGFVELLRSERGAAVFRRHGFAVLEGG